MNDGRRADGTSGKGRNWLIGCSVGCAALVFVMLALMGSCYALLRSATGRFDAAVETHQELDRRFGVSGDFTPWPAGPVPAERMAAFLAVREASQPARERLAQTFHRMPMGADQARELEARGRGEKLRSVFSILRSAMSLPGGLGDFFEARNRALLDAGMGLGEYRYIYALCYPGPTDGERRGVVVGAGDRPQEEFLGMLRRQFAALPAGDGQEQAAWRERLAAEIRALESDPRRRPWQDGLPPSIAASIEPYRVRLDAAYDPATSALELGRTERRSHFSYTVD